MGMFPPSVSFSGLPSVMKGFVKNGVCLLVCLFPLFSLHAQTNLIQLRSFGVTAFSGAQPQGRLLSGSDGFLYGTTPFGGSNGFGTIFRIKQDGAGFTVLHQFAGPEDGSTPYAGVIEGKDGFLYGTAYSGGADGLGTIYKMSKDAATFQVLWGFGASLGDGGNSDAELLEASNGFLYGTTTSGGKNGGGTVFRIMRGGDKYSTIRDFSMRTAGDGELPNSSLIEGPNQEGFLYGTTDLGGSNDVGTVYKISADGSTFKLLLQPSSVIGSPEGIKGGVVLKDGLLYGVSQYGGTNDFGTVFRLDREGGNLGIIRHFQQFNDANYPVSGLLAASDGYLYGVSPVGGTNNLGTVFRLDPANPGGTYQAIKHFGSFQSDGRAPAAGLIEASNLLFTVTTQGGASGDGAVVRMNRDGTDARVVFGFSAAGGDGFTLDQSVYIDPAGFIYGVTRDGGSKGGGTLYRIDRSGGGYTVLHDFGTGSTNLFNPAGPVVGDGSGNLFGTALGGGESGLGGVYGIGTNGMGFRVVRSFTTTVGDGQQPSGSLLIGGDGALYGTTRLGGSSSTGAVYRLTVDGLQFRVLHSFIDAVNDGAGPRNGVVDSGNDLFGVTPYGGSTDWGTIFRTDRFRGTNYSILHHFGATATDGLDPSGGLLKASDGRLYGVTRVGGASGFGTVFRYDPSNSGYTVLLSITNAATQGYQPVGRLVEGADGLLYGAMSAGGSFSVGTLYRLAKDGSGLTSLYHFGVPGEGRLPVAGLAVGGDSVFGTTFAGGEANLGTLFQFIAPPPAPTIVADPLSAITAPGQSLILSVSATASGPVLFQWQRNGVEIPGATASNLLLGPITFTNGASYRVVVSSSGGSLSSTNAAVAVFSGTRSGDALQLQIAGPAGKALTLESKMDLQSATPWQTFSNVLMQGSLQTVVDPGSAGQPERYFRAVLP
jgi:uncharacterized repeat protein (TIGR03803 family)